ncbi:MAG TPA: TonB family protein [Geobacteraceae bacterium]|nr:TonB family protein [Geobacteraceae bacterium]
MSYKYTDSYIEKTFLYLLAFSLLLHAAMFALVAFIPQEKKVAKEEPVMIDLQDLPPSPETPAKEKKEVRRFAEEKRRFAREMAPKGEMEHNRLAPRPQRIVPPVAQPQHRGGETAPWMPPERGKGPLREEQPGEDLLRHRTQEPASLAKLFPGADKMARLEENYRKKYESDVEEGDTKFLNTDDIQFGSFLRRFETAVYGVWNYPEEAARRGIEGMTPVRITFNRKGEIEKVDVLESSGSMLLDNEVLRTLRNIGPVGSFPKGYNKEKFYLIAFFQYGLFRGVSRSLH